ncbi:MAG: DAK2 domain-containing protein, partial [Candidatus Eremiobacteraeota bacterium]|nr:DAK2 domain-containing protein [Candidatus Eremiobacteraeota bacterium]
MDVRVLDGRGYAKFIIAGAFFLRKYRGVLNDLNVFPVPDGDTGTNMYLTIRSAAVQAARVQREPLFEVAAAAAEGSLMGARGNSGVIISQMLRGFAHHVRRRSEIDTFTLATAMRESVAAARAALVRPLEGTILSVAAAAADAAYHLALREKDFYRVVAGALRAAAKALDHTIEQLPALKEAGVVDAGGAGFVYFMEGILRFLPDEKSRTTAFPRRPIRRTVFTPRQNVGVNRFCTEFIVEDADCDLEQLRRSLEPLGDSLIVAGERPTYRVHVHACAPENVQRAAAKFGTLQRIKVDNMEQQHQVLLVDREPVLSGVEGARPFSVVAVVPGTGFQKIAQELGAEIAMVANGNPSVEELLSAVNGTLSDRVILLPNDSNVMLAAKEAAERSMHEVKIAPARDIVGGIAALLALRGRQGAPENAEIADAISKSRSAAVFFAARGATRNGSTVKAGSPAALCDGRLFGGPTLAQAARDALTAMGVASGGLITIYYGGSQSERDAQRMRDELEASLPGFEVEYYFGGKHGQEYVISYDE